MRRFNVFHQNTRTAFEDDTETDGDNANPAPTDQATPPADPAPAPAASTDPVEPDTSVTNTDENNEAPSSTAAPAPDAQTPEKDEMVLPVGVELVVAHDEDRAAIESAINEVVAIDGEAVMFANAQREVELMRDKLQESTAPTRSEAALIQLRTTEIAQNLLTTPVVVVQPSFEDEAATQTYFDKLSSHLGELSEVIDKAGKYNIDCMLRSIYNAAELKLESLNTSEAALKDAARATRNISPADRVYTPTEFAQLGRFIVMPCVESCMKGEVKLVLTNMEDSPEVLRVFSSYISIYRSLITALTNGAGQLLSIVTARDTADMVGLVKKATSVFEVAIAQAFRGLPRDLQQVSYIEPMATPSMFGMVENASSEPVVVGVSVGEIKLTEDAEAVKYNLTNLSDTFYAAAGAAGALRYELASEATKALKSRVDAVVEAYAGLEAQEVLKLIQSSPEANEAFLSYMGRLKNAVLFVLGLNACYIGALTNIALFAQNVAGLAKQPSTNPEV